MMLVTKSVKAIRTSTGTAFKVKFTCEGSMTESYARTKEVIGDVQKNISVCEANFVKVKRLNDSFCQVTWSILTNGEDEAVLTDTLERVTGDVSAH